MKTTVEIAEHLLRQAKSTAHREGTTLRALLEEGLRWALGRRRRKPDFELADGRVPGKGATFSRFPKLRTRNPLVG